MCSAALLLHCRQAVFQWLGTRTALYGDGVHHTGPFILCCWPAVFFTLELHTEYGTYLTALTVGPVRGSGYVPLIRTRSEGFSLLGTWACLCINNILPVVKRPVTSAYWKQRFVSLFLKEHLKFCFREVFSCGSWCPVEHVLVSKAGSCSLLLCSIHSPAASRGKEALSELIPRSVGGWMGIPLVQAFHGHGACSPGNSGVAGFFVCSTAALISPSRTQLYVNLSFTEDWRNPLWKSLLYFLLN